MSIKKKLETIAGITPAIAVMLCVSMSLSGYTPPAYSIDEVNADTDKGNETKEIKTLSVDIPVEIAEALADIEEPNGYKDGTYYGSAMGYNGMIKVKVVIKDGKIASIEIVSHIEDEPYWSNAKDSIIPAILQRQTTNVDAVSGATFTSNGIIEAVRNALAKASLNGKDKDLQTENTQTPAKPKDDREPEKLEEVEETGAYRDGIYYGSAEGFNDIIQVKVVVKDGKITSIEIVSHLEDPEYMDDAVNSIIPAIIEGQTTNVDTISGATFSSNGIIAAVRDALSQASISEDDGMTDDEQEEPEVPNVPEDPEEPGLPIDPEHPEDDEQNQDENVTYVYKDGEYTNDEKMVLCENPRDTSWAYYLSVKVVIEDGKIVSIKESKTAGKNGEYDMQNSSYLKRAFDGIGSRKGMSAKIVEAQGTEGVDTVTGATISSTSIIESVNLILPAIEKVPVEAENEEAPGADMDAANEEALLPMKKTETEKE